jgi:hypothetical protein
MAASCSPSAWHAWHYIGVKLDEGSDTDVPITRDVTVAGDEIPAPGYAGNGVRTDTSRTSPADQPRERPSATGRTTTIAPPWWLLTAAGVSVVAVLVIVVVLVRRRVRP